MNQFPNQFNIALNREAAKCIFSKVDDFAKFIIVPTHTTQALKYNLAELIPGSGRAYEKRFLGFNCRLDPMKLATGESTITDFPNKVILADLTALFCAFSSGFKGSTLEKSFFPLHPTAEQLVLTRDKPSDVAFAEISFVDLQGDTVITNKDIQWVMSRLEI